MHYEESFTLVAPNIILNQPDWKLTESIVQIVRAELLRLFYLTFFFLLLFQHFSRLSFSFPSLNNFAMLSLFRLLLYFIESICYVQGMYFISM